jgi:hypothetical protein
VSNTNTVRHRHDREGTGHCIVGRCDVAAPPRAPTPTAKLDTGSPGVASTMSGPTLVRRCHAARSWNSASLLAANDLLLRLEAWGEGVPNVCRQRKSGLPWQWFVNVLLDPGPTGEKCKQSFCVRRLAERHRFRNGNVLADLDETVLARCRTRPRATSRDERFTFAKLLGAAQTRTPLSGSAPRAPDTRRSRRSSRRRR